MVTEDLLAGFGFFFTLRVPGVSSVLTREFGEFVIDRNHCKIWDLFYEVLGLLHRAPIIACEIGDIQKVSLPHHQI